MTVVVVQSDELSAWIGVAGVAVGVVLSTGIDWWRSRRTGRRELRHRLLQAGSDLAAAATGYQSTTRAAGAAMSEPAWHELIQARLEALRTAYLIINLAGDKGVEVAAGHIVKVAFDAAASSDMTVITQQMREQGAALAAYREAVRKAKL